MLKSPFAALLAIAVSTSAIEAAATAAPDTAAFSDSPLYAYVQDGIRRMNSDAPSFQGNHVAIINNGYDALLLRVHLIRQATRSIQIQTFIWTNDECGRLLMWELIAAAQRGVRVQILADHFVSDQDPGTIAAVASAHENLELRHYRPPGKRLKPSRLDVMRSAVRSFRSFNQRMHNKVMLVDGIVGLTGGRNIENTYFDHSLDMNFKDRDALVIGPVVAEMTASFRQFWDYKHAVPSKRLVDVAKRLKSGDFPDATQRANFGFGGHFTALDQLADHTGAIRERIVSRLHSADRVEFVADTPGKNRRLFLLSGSGRITQRLGQVLRETKREVVLQSPYLIVSGEARKLFIEMRKANPKLRVVVSSNSFGSTDNLVAYSANYRLRETLIEDLGFLIYEYRPQPADRDRVFPLYETMKRLSEARKLREPDARLPFLCIHAKSFVIDSRIAYIGSYNLDPRSANLNTEVGLLIEDAEIAKELRQDIVTDTLPRNSWVIAKREVPLGMGRVNRLVSEVFRLSQVDLWPLRNTSSFELREGKAPLAPTHPDFYEHYRSVGSFPGADGSSPQKRLVTRIYKAVGGAATPLM